MGTKRTCERCGREFISHGSPLCSGCERATHKQAAQRAARTRRRQQRIDAKQRHQSGPSNA
jgi:uncharacterized Zn finger protein (UPF0148 family)